MSTTATELTKEEANKLINIGVSALDKIEPIMQSFGFIKEYSDNIPFYTKTENNTYFEVTGYFPTDLFCLKIIKNTQIKNYNSISIEELINRFGI